MKATITILAIVMSGALAVAQTTVTEQTTTSGAAGSATVTTTTSTGTIHEYSPGTTFIVKESSGPVSYRYGDGVTYVTHSGQTLTEEQVRTRVKVGTPVSVHYVTQGDTRVVRRIEVDDDDDDDDD